MLITQIETTPLFVPYKRPYHWAQGIVHGAEVILITIYTDEGVTGHGECISSPCPSAIKAYLDHAASLCVGHDPFDSTALINKVHQHLFQGFGTCSSPRFAGRILAGLEMAIWDVVGKSLQQPIHRLLGGAVREHVGYFGFAQGETATETAEDARILMEEGFKVIYVKVGRGDKLDLETVKHVREAIGENTRLRVDANEKWSVTHTKRMIKLMSRFGVECIEQPTPCESPAALSQVHSSSPVAIAADQAIFSPFDAYEICHTKAADLIVAGVHETGGLRNLLHVAAIAQTAGIDICLHGLYETGITTCAGNQAAAAIPNLDDANQHMTRFLAWDIVKTPELKPIQGQLPILRAPGLGFELDIQAVNRASALYHERNR